MASRVFHLFVRRFAKLGYSAQVLGFPHLASFGETMLEVNADLSKVCGRLLARGELPEPGPTPSYTLRRVELSLRAMQRGRLLTVPMRFSALLRAAGVVGKAKPSRGPVTVLVPRLGIEQTLQDVADFDSFAEELVRHELHLAPLERLLEVSYGGEESVRTLTVDAPSARTLARRARVTQKKVRRQPLPPGLDEACRRLSDERNAGTVERAYQRDPDLAQLADAVAGTQKSSVLLVGPSMVGKTALVHELVHRIAAAEPKTALHGFEVYSTSGARIFAGMRYLGQWQDRVKRMVGSLRTRRAVLHLDSLAEFLSAGGKSDTGLDLARQLLPSIETGEVCVVIEATAEDVARAERTHGAFLRALRSQVVLPLPLAAAQQALASAARRVSRDRRVTVDGSALTRAVDLVDRFGEAGGLPGAAVDLLRAAARPAPGAKVGLVDGETVTRAFVQRTGYPRELIDPSVSLQPERVLERLRERVVGQDEATLLLRDLVVTLKSGLCDPSRPLGAYLLMGPTGVGKTESALSLCAYLFGDEHRLTRFDMAEYAAPHSAARLVSAGSGQGGSLTARVREQPFGVVLLDEIEKAHAGVHDLLLQLLGEGRLSDSAGRTVSFRNTVVLLTSNLGAESSGRSLGFGDAAVGARAHYLAAASQFFRPELVNRLDHVVAYHPLSRAHIRQIAGRVLDAALGREGLVQRGVKVTYGDEVVDRLAEVGFDERYGARPLKRAVEQHVVASIAHLLAEAGATPPGSIVLTVDDGRFVARPG